MRLSANMDSPDYVWHKIEDAGGDPNTLTITVNGVVREDSVEADDVEGWADVLARDEHGDFVLNDSGEGHKIERVHGTVAFAWKPLTTENPK